MYGFEHMLFENEKLVYSGRARPDLLPKDKELGLAYVLTTIFLFFVVCFLIYNIFTAEVIQAGAFFGIPIFGLASFVLAYNGIYKKFIKKKKIKYYEYGITNLRILVYNKKTRKLFEGPLREYINIYIINTENNCGDVVFDKSFNMNGLNDKDEQAQPVLIGEQTDILVFEAVDDPKEIKKIAIELRNKLKN